MYCSNCGKQMNYNSNFCANCGKKNVVYNQVNNTNYNQKKVSVGKVYLKLFIISICLFFAMTFISLILSLVGIEKNSLLESVISIIQIGIPICLISFGWIPALIYASEKNQ